MTNLFTNKKLLTTAAISIVALTTYTTAHAITGTATAKVLTPIAVTQTTQLDFGTFTAGAAVGSIDQNGATTAGGGATKVADGADGVFTVTGEASTNYTVNIPATTVLTGAGTDMTVTFDAVAAQALDASGDDTFNVTGDLAVAANQAAGTYNGTYTVTVSY
jgi:hypothetical protein